MTEEELRNFLLDHAKHPRNEGVIADASGKGECRNPLCGDHVKVTVLTSDDEITDLKIKAAGCSISIASASLMSSIVKKHKVSEVSDLVKTVAATLAARPSEDWPESLEELSPFKRMRENPMKIPCVLISWMAAKEALENLNS